jgi:hypothetical protein
MLTFFPRLLLALKFCIVLGYGWRRAWINARREADYELAIPLPIDEHADVSHAGML